jgi:sugar phosphate isomerase/epimerase
MAELSRLSLNTATLRDQWSLAQCIEGCARHGIPGISPWRDKLAEYGVERTAKHIRDAGLRVSGLCRGGFFTENLKAGIEDTRRAVDEAQAIGADCLVMLAGGLPPGSRDLNAARFIVMEGLSAVQPHAKAAGVKLALEPLHPMTCADRSVLTTLGQALDWADVLGGDVGVALDVYHVWWDPTLPEQITRAGPRIHGFHVCDFLNPTRDTVFDRGMMGDGAIDIPAIRAMVEAQLYAGLIEVEILSRDWWARDPDDVLRVVKERFAAAV